MHADGDACSTPHQLSSAGQQAKADPWHATEDVEMNVDAGMVLLEMMVVLPQKMWMLLHPAKPVWQ
eukprot:356120-Chlamydomonas_euryale.AAC.8